LFVKAGINSTGAAIPFLTKLRDSIGTCVVAPDDFLHKQWEKRNLQNQESDHQKAKVGAPPDLLVVEVLRW